MANEQLISAEVYCLHEGVEMTFVRSLHERGLIEVTIVREEHFIAPGMLPRLEKLARLHYDLDIDLAGIEAISHLLERVEGMQDDLRALRDRLRLYEAGGEPF